MALLGAAKALYRGGLVNPVGRVVTGGLAGGVTGGIMAYREGDEFSGRNTTLNRMVAGIAGGAALGAIGTFAGGAAGAMTRGMGRRAGAGISTRFARWDRGIAQQAVMERSIHQHITGNTLSPRAAIRRAMGTRVRGGLGAIPGNLDRGMSKVAGAIPGAASTVLGVGVAGAAIYAGVAGVSAYNAAGRRSRLNRFYNSAQGDMVMGMHRGRH